MPYKLRIVLIGVVALTLLAALGYFNLQRSGLLKPSGWAAPLSPVAEVNTRLHLRDGALMGGHDKYEYDVAGPFPGLAPGLAAPADLVVVVHGFNNTADKARSRFATARDGLAAAGYTGGVVGYSWDADTQHDPLAMTGYHAGMRTAEANGPKLAQFLADYHARCPDTRLHLIGYSMGARLALEALRALETDPRFSAAACPLASLHLVGAAVENEDAELGARYGAAIAGQCGTAVNYFSPEDDKLGWFYPLKEGDRALGITGIEHPQKAPPNYRDVDATAELPPLDSAGRMEDEEYGDNHSGYLGVSAADGTLLDDGVMDLVAANIAAGPDVP